MMDDRFTARDPCRFHKILDHLNGRVCRVASGVGGWGGVGSGGANYHLSNLIRGSVT